MLLVRLMKFRQCVVSHVSKFLHTGRSIGMVPNYVSDVLSMLSACHALQDDDPIHVVSSSFITDDVS